jgi:hypothetical protein
MNVISLDQKGDGKKGEKDTRLIRDFREGEFDKFRHNYWSANKIYLI